MNHETVSFLWHCVLPALDSDFMCAVLHLILEIITLLECAKKKKRRDKHTHSQYLLHVSLGKLHHIFACALPSPLGTFLSTPKLSKLFLL